MSYLKIDETASISVSNLVWIVCVCDEAETSQASGEADDDSCSDEDTGGWIKGRFSLREVALYIYISV